MQITVYSTKAYDRASFEQENKTQPDISLVYQGAALSKDTAILAKGSDGVCIFVDDDAQKEVLQELSKLGVKAVFLRSAGFDNVDLDAAKELGIRVSRVPKYSPESVAEHALTLALTVNRHVHRAYTRIREGNFDLTGLEGHTVSGKTVGVVGTGNIGRLTAQYFKGLGCKILGYDIFESDAFVGTYVPLEKLLSESFIVSLHLPLNKETHHIMGEKALSQLPEGAVLVNTSRGALIDTEAALEALKKKKLGALAIDVYENEGPLFYSNHEDTVIDDSVYLQLASLPNVLITGHQGFFTKEALHEIARVTLSNVAGDTSNNVV